MPSTPEHPEHSTAVDQPTARQGADHSSASRPGGARRYRRAALAGAVALLTVGSLGAAATGCQQPGPPSAQDVTLPQGWKPWQTTVQGSGDAGPTEDEENNCRTAHGSSGSLYCAGSGFRSTQLQVDNGTRKAGKPGESGDFAYRDGRVFTTEEAKDDDGQPAQKVHARDDTSRTDHWSHLTGAEPVLTRDGVVGLEQTPQHDRGEEAPPESEPGGDVIAWKPGSGDEKWRISTPDDRHCQPLAAAKRTFVSCAEAPNRDDADTTLYRVDTEHEKLHRLTTLKSDMPVGAQPEPGKEGFLGYDRGALVFLPNSGDDLYSAKFTKLLRVDAHSGKTETVKLPSGFPNSGTDMASFRADLADGAVYFREFTGKKEKSTRLLAVDATTGEQQWQRKLQRKQLSAPDVSAKLGEVYFADHAGRLSALDRATGEEHWGVDDARAKDGGTDTGELDAPAGVSRVQDVVVVSAGNTVYTVNPADPQAKPTKRTERVDNAE